MSDERYAQLQRTLIESAKQHLVELTGALALPNGVDRNEGVSSAWWQLTALTQLTNFDSGLDEATKHELRAIDQLAIQATTQPVDKALVASEADSEIAAALADPTSSHWFRHSLQQALPRDPVDAVNDAEWLFELLNKRCVAQLQDDPAPPMNMAFRTADGRTTQIDIAQATPVIELGDFKA
ncbi:hypothetical protein ACF8LF_00020 [Pseudomonas putida]|jgi:hypothetical protein|uniref:Uncharacterized protein n=5 Tax=Pseudomonas TaxID=286 RepID=A0A6H1QBP7_PSEAI|nr:MULTISPECIES: hypothetical protein [Pseudomonas]GJB83783.1 hypothetical protein KAM380_082480 [Aeromonas caviae]ATB51932.1 hypothetical protein [Pseudomonas putida]EIU1419869.1 hypothetical protein [Pseudomonas aeruginosa]EKT8499376.1 hypothetical protein [Pseudomonas aeruginosa]EKT9494111.1 hypothetical protein [Pseudomonas aeruginosa]